MLPLDALRGIRPLIATPCYAFNTTAPYTASLFTLASHAAQLGLELQVEHAGESLIPRSRNRLAAKFMAGNYTHLFFIDADIQFSSSAFFRLLLADRDIAVQVYPLKQLEPSYPFFPINPGESDADGFGEVYPATTGFMCIQRHVIEKLQAAYPEREYLPDTPDDPHRYFDLFPAFIEPESRHYWSEDYGLCWLWHQIGGQVWADVHSKLSHYGQHLFRGDLMEHLRNGKEAPRRVQEAA